MSQMETMDRGALKLGMIMYWSLLAIGIVVLIIARTVMEGSIFLSGVGMVIPGIFGLISTLRNFFKTNENGFVGTIMWTWVYILMWVLLGFVFGLIKAIQCTNAFVKSKKNEE